MVRKNRSAPEATVVPVLIYEDVERAVSWLCDTFGFEERLRFVGRDGAVEHAQIDVADGAIMIGRRGGPFRPPRDGEVTQYVHVTVRDVDAHYERVRASGATVVDEPMDMPFGERQYRVADLEDHWWTFSEHIADVPPEEWGAVQATGPARSG